MRIKIKFRSVTSIRINADEPYPDYPLHFSSFYASLALHGAIIAGLAMVSTFPAASDRPVYDEFIKPHEHDILYYHLPLQVPDVAPAQKTVKPAEPRAVTPSKRAIVATPPKPDSAKLFVMVPAPQIKITQDLATPLLIAQLDTTLPPPPPPPKPQPRKFVPPPQQHAAPARLSMPLTQAPTLATPATPLALNGTLPTALAPPKKAPEASVVKNGNATADVAVASVDSNQKADVKIPNGERAGAFSKAPIQDRVPSGGDTGSLTVPDLTVQKPKPEPSAARPLQQIPSRQVLYRDLVRDIPLSTLSAPLRPSSRTVPQFVDARFQGRDVYTIVIPMENMPVYDGDWIMWFAAREPKPGPTPLVRAPTPLRKLEIPDHTPGVRTPERVQLAGMVTKDGKLSGVAVVGKAPPAMERAVLQDLNSWSFQPATQDGVAVDVDVVIEIPFSLPVALAKSP